jgi:uncharacterized protein (TIGR01244 family)
MLDLRRIDDRVSVAPQIAPEDMPAVKAAGFATVINNRPDDEEPGQPSAAAIAAAADAAGLRYVAIPVAGGFTTDDVEAMADALGHGPTLAFCRSGTRSCNLWALARAANGDDPDTLTEAAAQAGYDLRGIRPILDQLARRS